MRHLGNANSEVYAHEKSERLSTIFHVITVKSKKCFGTMKHDVKYFFGNSCISLIIQLLGSKNLTARTGTYLWRTECKCQSDIG